MDREVFNNALHTMLGAEAPAGNVVDDLTAALTAKGGGVNAPQGRDVVARFGSYEAHISVTKVLNIAAAVLKASQGDGLSLAAGASLLATIVSLRVVAQSLSGDEALVCTLLTEKGEGGIARRSLDYARLQEEFTKNSWSKANAADELEQALATLKKLDCIRQETRDGIPYVELKEVVVILW